MSLNPSSSLCNQAYFHSCPSSIVFSGPYSGIYPSQITINSGGVISSRCQAGAGAGLEMTERVQTYRLCSSESEGVLEGTFNVLYHQEGSNNVLVVSKKWFSREGWFDISKPLRVRWIFEELYGADIAKHMCQNIIRNPINTSEAFAYETPYIENIKDKRPSDREFFLEVLRIMVETARIAGDALGEDNTVKLVINCKKRVIVRDVENCFRYDDVTVSGIERRASFQNTLTPSLGHLKREISKRSTPKSQDAYITLLHKYIPFLTHESFKEYSYTVNLTLLLMRLCCFYPAGQVRDFIDSHLYQTEDPYSTFLSWHEDLKKVHRIRTVRGLQNLPESWRSSLGSPRKNMSSRSINACNPIALKSPAKSPRMIAGLKTTDLEGELRNDIDSERKESVSPKASETTEDEFRAAAYETLVEVLENIRDSSKNKGKSYFATHYLRVFDGLWKRVAGKDLKVKTLKVMYILTLRMATHHTNWFKSRDRIDLNKKDGPKSYQDNYENFRSLGDYFDGEAIEPGRIIHDCHPQSFFKGSGAFLTWKKIRDTYALDKDACKDGLKQYIKDKAQQLP